MNVTYAQVKNALLDIKVLRGRDFALDFLRKHGDGFESISALVRSPTALTSIVRAIEKEYPGFVTWPKPQPKAGIPSQGHDNVLITGNTSTCLTCSKVWDTNDPDPPKCREVSSPPVLGMGYASGGFTPRVGEAPGEVSLRITDCDEAFKRIADQVCARVDAPAILDAAAGHLRDRAAARDQPDGERSMHRCITAYNAITGHALSERDGWLFMVILKATRACNTATGIADDYTDLAAYSALAGESVSK